MDTHPERSSGTRSTKTARRQVKTYMIESLRLAYQDKVPPPVPACHMQLLNLTKHTLNLATIPEHSYLQPKVTASVPT